MNGRRWTTFLLGLLLMGSVATAAPAASPSPAAAQGAPAPATEGAAGWRMVSAGQYHTCGIRVTGRLYCWGDNTWGQIGRGTQAPGNPFYPTAVEVSPGASNWTSVSAGDDHTCGRRANGRIYCWGSNIYGRLGDGTDTHRLVPTPVAGGHTDWVSVSAGEDHTCGRRANGRLYCWGSDRYGQLGDGGSVTDHWRPGLVAGGITNWVEVDAGYVQTCARRADGTAWCWGDDDYGSVGDGSGVTRRLAPRRVAGGISDWTRIVAGDFHACGLRASGRLLCWGGDYSQDLGNGAGVRNGFAPGPVAGGITDWATVDAGEHHTCARRRGGQLWCWGNGSSGQRGDGSLATASAPERVVGTGVWTAVSTGARHTCGLRSTRQLFCWGEGDDYRLGNADAVDQARPAEVYFPA